MSRSLSKPALMSTIDRIKLHHKNEINKMKILLLEEKIKVKELEDKFGVTQKKLWETRKRSWWMKWLYDTDTDAYEYLLKTIHKALLFQEGSSLSLKEAKNNLTHVNWTKKNYHDLCINLYGMKLLSVTFWWRRTGETFVSLYNHPRHQNLRTPDGHKQELRSPNIPKQTKKYLIDCCKQNNMEYRSSWKKSRLMQIFIPKMKGAVFVDVVHGA